jgi:hypothetical protein
MARIDVNHQTIRLAKGSHKPTEGRGCFVEVAGLLHTGRWTGDAPDCFCPALMAFGRKFNDWLRDDERHVLWPFTLRMGGTADDGRLRERGIRFADLAVREVAPLALEARGRAEDAARLRALAPVVDRQSAACAAYAAHCVAYAAADAADAAACAADAASAAHAAACAADAAYADAAYAAAAYAAAAAAFADRQRAIDLCLAVLDELCPSAPCAQDAELLNWAALQSLVRA